MHEDPTKPAGALKMAADFAAGISTPLLALQACLARADQVPYVLIARTEERARREAAAATQRWQQGRPLSMLDGVPVTWKDLIDVDATVTTAGSATRRTATPAQADAAAVALARDYGLVTLGKTNLTEFAYSGLGLNPHFGTPVNPALGAGSRAPGGSSSGAAIAVACGISPLAMGTDTAGSVRIPAAFNGLVGYKSSNARYSQRGVFPLSRTLDTLGPLARDVADCIAFDRVLTGRPFGPVPAPALPGGLHLVIDSAALHGDQLSDAVRSNLAASVNRLREAGATVVERPLPSRREFELALDSHGWPGAFEAYLQHRDLLASPQAALLDPRVRARLEAARAMPEATYLRLLELRRVLMRQIQAELDGATLILPTVAHTAPALAPLQDDARHFSEMNLRTLRITMFGSFLDMAAFTVPNGTDAEGLPTGLQLLLPSGHDDSLFSAALAVEPIVR